MSDARNAEQHSSEERSPDPVIAGKYRVDAVIGTGGMGVVLRARHIKLDKSVAIKLLRPDMMKAPGMVTRFLREARAAAKVKSDHVVRVTDADVLPSGAPYMVMEYLDGMDLQAALTENEGSLPVSQAVDYVIQACDAIADAHRAGIVHLDLKPANLFLARCRGGKSVIKVLDFGISKIDAPGEQDPTETGQIMGSPRFMSPEQMLSKSEVDGRADIWALGAILYNLLTGRPPFIASTMPRLCARILSAEPAPLHVYRPEIPAELNAIVLRCLRKNPDGRFATARELAEALAHFSGGTTAESARAPASFPAETLAASSQHATAMNVINSKPPSMRRSRGGLLAGAVVALTLGFAAILTSRWAIPPAREAATGTAASGDESVSAPIPRLAEPIVASNSCA